MKIHLPNSAFLGNIDPFLRSFDTSDAEKLIITANKDWISVHPMVLTMLASLGRKVKRENIHCEKFEAKSKHYFERMGLFRFLGIESGISIKEHEAAGRFIPLTKIQNSNELHSFITDMIPILHLEPKQVEPIRYIISELVRNVFEHSESKNGAIVCAQLYKKHNVIRIGVADTGVGIKTTINKSYRADTDMEAIKLALTPGVTGTTRLPGGTPENAGMGLFFIKSMAKINKDFFVIYSGNAMYKLLRIPKDKNHIRLNSNPFEDRHSKDEDYPYWEGTIVGIDISLDRNKRIDELLEMIRKVYQKETSERKKKIFKKPRFI
ncbi:ATP-binding protein [Candidatus Woesearchaeota archaeon]|nr:ATP-binding protein [Candidatus Woesearchaeota archaeon]